jgi:4-azaleucine resistance transporter AzlC
MPSHTRAAVKEGLLAALPMCVAMAPIALLFGALAGKAGLALGEIALMSGLVFAGAAQFVAIEMWREPLPVVSILLTTLLVNLRHVIMGASLGRRLDAFGPRQRALAFFLMADEIWALAEARARRGGLPPAYYFGLAGPFLATWVTVSTLGGVFGAALGDPATFGFDFVFNALFIALVVGFRAVPGWALVVAASAGAALLAHGVLPKPWYILAGAAAGMAVAALRAPAAPERSTTHGP